MARSQKQKSSYVGKSGGSVSYWLNGQWVTRTIGKNNNPPTILQIAVKHLTAVVSTLLRPVKNFIKLGFSMEVKGTNMNSYNKAFKENYVKAIQGIYPDIIIDYPNAVFSKGNMPVNEETSARMTAEGVRFSWDATLNLKGMHPNDRVMMIAYCPEKKYAFYDPDGARRKEGTDFLPMVKYPERVTIHTYVAFIAADKKSISTTFYTGEFLW